MMKKNKEVSKYIRKEIHFYKSSYVKEIFSKVRENVHIEFFKTHLGV